MTRTEALALTRYVQALCPAQKLDQYSADAWHDVLGDLPLEVAKKAAAMCARRRPFVAPSEIVEAATRLRRAVRAQVEREAADADAPQDGAAYVEWRRQQVARELAEADRRITDGVYDLTGVDVTGDWSEPPILTRTDRRPAIEARREVDARGQQKVLLTADTLARVKAIRKATSAAHTEETA